MRRCAAGWAGGCGNYFSATDYDGTGIDYCSAADDDAGVGDHQVLRGKKCGAQGQQGGNGKLSFHSHDPLTEHNKLAFQISGADGEGILAKSPNESTIEVFPNHKKRAPGRR